MKARSLLITFLSISVSTSSLFQGAARRLEDSASVSTSKVDSFPNSEIKIEDKVAARNAFFAPPSDIKTQLIRPSLDFEDDIVKVALRIERFRAGTSDAEAMMLASEDQEIHSHSQAQALNTSTSLKGFFPPRATDSAEPAQTQNSFAKQSSQALATGQSQSQPRALSPELEFVQGFFDHLAQISTI